MKPGREYESFIFDTFTKFFPAFEVKQNDRILGSESGLRREIDVSIRGSIGDVKLLYVVQAKDHNRPADIKILGEFSAVIRDVGASKGFLICASGFAKTIRHYARRLGIDLLTVRDINSANWKAEVQIPVIFRHYEIPYNFKVHVIVSQALAEANRVDLHVNFNECAWSLDAGTTFQGPDDTITALLLQTGRDLDELDEETSLELKLAPALTMVSVGGFPCLIEAGVVELEMTRKSFLKMVAPDEYREINDHVRDTKLPTQFKVGAKIDVSDGSWAEIEYPSISIAPAAVVVELELTPAPLRGRQAAEAEPPQNRAVRRAARSKRQK